MIRLPIKWQDLEFAFENRPDDIGSECSHYFDLENGEVIFVDEEITSMANGVVDELHAVSDEGAELTDAAIRGAHAFQCLADYEKQSVLAAIAIQYGGSTQLEEIPYFDSHEAYEFMKDFIETVNDDVKRNQLCDAIAGRRPFRRFRDLLAEDRRLQRQWDEFVNSRHHERIMEWLQSIGVEPTNPTTPTRNLPPLPDLRKIMFTEVRRFVRFARDIQGVRRIALIGSLTTEKEFPKDIDLLVTVSDDCDLTPLAKLGRQLAGHMNSHSAGADVFLSSESGEYLGRICQWRDCGPDYRTSCDALHCGLRHYLHDDFNSVCLKDKLVVQPPVLLWPDLAAAPNAPPDVHQELIEQLEVDEKR